MTVQQHKLPPEMVRPMGAVFGPIGIGKTTQLVRAFPRWLFLKTSSTALDAAVDVIRHQPELAKSWGLTGEPAHQYNLINDKSTEWVVWLENFCVFVEVSMTLRKQLWSKMSKADRAANRHLRLNLAGKSTKLGLDIPEPGVPGVVITEATALWASAFQSGKEEHGFGWDTNDRVEATLLRLIATMQKWNLGLFLDGHVAEAVVREQGESYPRGMAWPLGRMRQKGAVDLSIIWELVYEAEDDTGINVQRYFLTRPGYAPDRPLGTIRKTRRTNPNFPAKLSIDEKSMAEWLKELRFRVD